MPGITILRVVTNVFAHMVVNPYTHFSVNIFYYWNATLLSSMIKPVSESVNERVILPKEQISGRLRLV